MKNTNGVLRIFEYISRFYIGLTEDSDTKQYNMQFGLRKTTLFCSLNLMGFPRASVCWILLLDFLIGQFDLGGPGGRGVMDSIIGSCGKMYGDGPRPWSISFISWVYSCSVRWFSCEWNRVLNDYNGTIFVSLFLNCPVDMSFDYW